MSIGGRWWSLLVIYHVAFKFTAVYIVVTKPWLNQGETVIASVPNNPHFGVATGNVMYSACVKTRKYVLLTVNVF